MPAAVIVRSSTRLSDMVSTKNALLFGIAVVTGQEVPSRRHLNVKSLARPSPSAPDAVDLIPFSAGSIRIEPAENGIKSTASGADGEGLASDFTFKCRLDGTSCPVTTAMPNRSAFLVDTISLKRVDDRTMTAAGMKDGKLVYSDLRVVSLDGSTLTVTREGTTPEGKRYRSTIVLTRSH